MMGNDDGEKRQSTTNGNLMISDNAKTYQTSTKYAARIAQALNCSTYCEGVDTDPNTPLYLLTFVFVPFNNSNGKVWRKSTDPKSCCEIDCMLKLVACIVLSGQPNEAA